jgi:hypothetical protein
MKSYVLQTRPLNESYKCTLFLNIKIPKQCCYDGPQTVMHTEPWAHCTVVSLINMYLWGAAFPLWDEKRAQGKLPPTQSQMLIYA